MKKCLIICLLSMMLFVSVCPVCVSATYDFDSRPMSREEIDEIMAAREFQLIDQPVEVMHINCFSVSPDGLIALGINSSPYAVINIYNTEGQFLYGYKFLNHGAFLTIFFQEENLSVYFGRSHLVATFDRFGTCVSMKEDLLTAKNNLLLDQITHSKPEGSIGEQKYFLDGGSLLRERSWSRFVVEDEKGNVRVIYDVSSGDKLLAVCDIACVMVLGFIVLKNRNEKRKAMPE